MYSWVRVCTSFNQFEIWSEVMSCHVMIRVTSCHLKSCHVMPCDVISRHVTWCHVVKWCHVITCHVMSRHVMWCPYMVCTLPQSPLQEAALFPTVRHLCLCPASGHTGTPLADPGREHRQSPCLETNQQNHLCCHGRSYNENSLKG